MIRVDLGHMIAVKARMAERIRRLEHRVGVVAFPVALAVCLSAAPVFPELGRGSALSRETTNNLYRNVFAGLTLIGKGSCASPSETLTADVHSIERPTEFQKGVCYAFVMPNDGRKPAYEVFEERLIKARVEILRHALDGGLIMSTFGEPIFDIELSLERHHARIRGIRFPQFEQMRLLHANGEAKRSFLAGSTKATWMNLR